MSPMSPMRENHTPKNLFETRRVALVGAAVLALVLGCDPDTTPRPTDEADPQGDQASVAQERLVDTLDRVNARIDMAAREALASAEEMEAQPTAVPDATNDANEGEVASNADADRDEFLAQSRERLRRMKSELEAIHARTDRRIDEIDANLEQDRRRAEERLERLIDASQDGYVHARDAVSQEIRELEARMHRLRERIEDAV